MVTYLQHAANNIIVVGKQHRDTDDFPTQYIYT